MRRWRSIGRCRPCKHWIAWQSRRPLSEAHCTCGAPLARTTFPTSSGASVLYREPLTEAEAARVRARRVTVSERDRQLADQPPGDRGEVCPSCSRYPSHCECDRTQEGRLL